MRRHYYLGMGVAVLLACSGLQAQTTPAVAADALQGPLLNGVCFLSRQAVFANAQVGKVAAQRLQQLASGAQSRFDTERAKLGDDARAFQQQASSLSAADRRTQAGGLDRRAQALEAERQRDIQQLELTRAQVMSRIAAQTQPILASLFKQHGCGLLLDRNVLLGGNPGNDLTPAVVAGLDAKMTTISFNLAPLPAASAQPSGAAQH